MSYFKSSERLPDTDRYVLVYDKPSFGEVWFPAQWTDGAWKIVGFEEEDELEFDISHWMEIDFDAGSIRSIDALPDNDRYVLIFSEKYFGDQVWHPAAWLGEDDGPGGEFCWAMVGLGYTKDQLQVTHWTEMPAIPE